MSKEREKGGRWERAVRDLFRGVMPGAEQEIDRCFQFRGDGDPDVRTPWFHVECKVGKSVPYSRALKQAASDSDVAGELMPIVVSKVDRQQPSVVLRLSDFLRLVEFMWAQEGTPRLRPLDDSP